MDVDAHCRDDAGFGRLVRAIRLGMVRLGTDPAEAEWIAQSFFALWDDPESDSVFEVDPWSWAALLHFSWGAGRGREAHREWKRAGEPMPSEVSSIWEGQLEARRGRGTGATAKGGKPNDAAYWGSAIRTWSASAVGKMGLPDADAEYLLRVGLPVTDRGRLRVVVPEGDEPNWREGLPLLASDEADVALCIDATSEVRVVALDGVHRHAANTGVERFGKFLKFYDSFHVRLSDPIYADASGELLNEMERRMYLTDPRVMFDDGAYWPGVVDGFLPRSVVIES